MRGIGIVLGLVLLAVNGCAAQQTDDQSALHPKEQIRFIKDRNGRKVGLTNRLILRLKKGASIEELTQKYNFKKVHRITDEIYVVEVDDVDTMLKMVERLKKDPAVKYAHPDYLKERIKR